MEGPREVTERRQGRMWLIKIILVGYNPAAAQETSRSSAPDHAPRGSHRH